MHGAALLNIDQSANQSMNQSIGGKNESSQTIIQVTLVWRLESLDFKN
jgi:hypothetical protein